MLQHHNQPMCTQSSPALHSVAPVTGGPAPAAHSHSKLPATLDHSTPQYAALYHIGSNGILLQYGLIYLFYNTANSLELSVQCSAEPTKSARPLFYNFESQFSVSNRFGLQFSIRKAVFPILVSVPSYPRANGGNYSIGRQVTLWQIRSARAVHNFSDTKCSNQKMKSGNRFVGVVP